MKFKTKTKAKSSHPETAEEWLEDGIAAEESGDRWTSVPDKAHRFYLHAVSSYQRAIELVGGTGGSRPIPESLDASTTATVHFDAVYNLARLYLQMGLVCALLPAAKVAVLRMGRRVHMELVDGWPASVDVKYNLACLLMAIVDIVREHVYDDDDDKDRVGNGGGKGQGQGQSGASGEMVKEAMELLEGCRGAQTLELQRLSLDEAVDGTSPDSATKGEEEGEANAMERDAMDTSAEVEVDVTTAVTNDILLDTLITMVECYTQFLDLEDTRDVQAGHAMKGLMESVVVPQMQAILPKCQTDDAGARSTAALHAMQLADIDHSFRIGVVSLDAWSDHLRQAMEVAGSVATYCANVDACISLADAMSRTTGMDQAHTWKVLSSGAATQIAKAIESSTSKAPQLWITRGDVELLRSNVMCEAAKRNRMTLLQNAAIYYKRAVSDSLPKDIREKNEAAMKLAIVQAETKPDVPVVPEMTREEATQIVRVARVDGLFQGSWRLLS